MSVTDLLQPQPAGLVQQVNTRLVTLVALSALKEQSLKTLVQWSV